MAFKRKRELTDQVIEGNCVAEVTSKDRRICFYDSNSESTEPPAKSSKSKVRFNQFANK